MIIIFAFSYAFTHLSHDPVFNDPLTAVVKTLAWMLGDLGYDSTFVNEDFPILTNFIFVLFVTSVAGFIIYMISGISSEEMQQNTEDSNTYFSTVLLMTQLYYDDFLSSLLWKDSFEIWFRQKFIKAQVNRSKDCATKESTIHKLKIPYKGSVITIMVTVSPNGAEN